MHNEIHSEWVCSPNKKNGEKKRENQHREWMAAVVWDSMLCIFRGILDSERRTKECVENCKHSVEFK